MLFDALFYILTLIAEILGTIGGFGSSVFFVPMASWFYDFQTVLGLTAFYHIFSNFSKIVLFKKGLDKRLLLYIGLPSVIFVIVGALLSRFIVNETGNLTLGVFLIAFSGFLLIKPSFRMNPTNRNAIWGGSISGFAAGLLGTGGAIRGLTLASFNIGKSTFLATSAFIDFGIDFTRFFVYLGQSYITKEILWKGPILFGISFLGSWIGKKILNRIPQKAFVNIALWLVFIVGISLVLKYLLH